MNMLNADPTYYDVLDITPDASPQEIRAAYLRAKSAYNKDSVALYSLISADETEEMLRKIEEAYYVLSSPEKRKDYDRNHGLLSIDEKELLRGRAPRTPKIVSIDRVPPMESSDADLLVAPTTDFTSGSRPSASVDSDIFSASEAPLPSHRSEPIAPPVAAAAAAPAPAPKAAPPPPPREDPALAQEIAAEGEWRGAFLRKIREMRRMSIEEVADYTKISKTYIIAIEEENFAKLPATVFVRGFVTQISKMLKLPADKVAPAYLARYQKARPDR